MQKFSIYLLIFSFFLGFGCSSPKKQDIHLKIIETTDVHGSIFPYDFINNKPIDHSIANISTYIKQQRKIKNQWTLLFDNGDILQGQPTVYYSNFIDTLRQNICAKTMNYLHYNAATVGNHDIEPGHSVYDKLKKEFHFPWMAANAWDTKKDRPYFQPYSIFTKNGVKVAVLGLITPGIPNWLPPSIYSGIEFRDMVKSAKLWMQVIKRKENPDIIVGLFHAGHDYTYGNETDTTWRNENATLLVAKEVPGFDVIFCGHDHDKFMQKVANINGDSVLVVDPKAHAEFIGTVDINLKWDTQKNKYIKNISGKIIESKQFPVDMAFMHQFKPEFVAIKKFVSQPVAYFTKALDGRKAFFGDNDFMDLIHKVQLKLSGADISLAAPLSMKAYIDTGEVKVNDMFKLYRFENLLYTMKMSGQEVKDFLEYSYGLWANQMKSPKDHLLLFNKDSKKLKNPYFNFDSGEGINYTVDVTKPEGQRVSISGFTNGNKFELNKIYKVALNSYRGNGGGGHLTKGAKIPKDSLVNRIISSTVKDLRYYMMQYLKKQKTINPTHNNNWKFVPETWTDKAAERDYQILMN